MVGAKISDHALERFLERLKIVHGKIREPERLLQKILQLARRETKSTPSYMERHKRWHTEAEFWATP